jgi:hypothetical protein
MMKLLAAAAVGGALVFGAMSGQAMATTKKYWDDGWATGGKKDWSGGSYTAKVNFLKGVAPSDWTQKGPYGNRDGVNTSERKGKSFVGRFTAFQLYNDDNLPSGKKPKLLGFDVVGGIAKIVPYTKDGKLFYAAVLQKGYNKGYAVVRWQLGKKTLYTSALRIVASPNDDKNGKPIYEPKDPKKDEWVAGAEMMGASGALSSAGSSSGGSSSGGVGRGDLCFKSPLGKIGVASASSCSVE